MSIWYLLLGLIVLQRLIELMIARVNTKRLLAIGGIEHGANHYFLLVALHSAWLASLVVFVPAEASIDPVLLTFFVVLQLGRVWVIKSLGRYWTTRVITVPDQSLIKGGPFRLIRHPNYLIVEAELIVVPLIAGAWELSIVFGVANALVLAWRIRVEEQAIAPRRS